jgi:hypothetical protein
MFLSKEYNINLSAQFFLSLFKMIKMEGAILQTESNQDLNLILQLAKKLGISVRKLSKDEIEDYGLSLAISEGKTGEYIDTDEFLKEIRNGSKD